MTTTSSNTDHVVLKQNGLTCGHCGQTMPSRASTMNRSWLQTRLDNDIRQITVAFALRALRRIYRRKYDQRDRPGIKRLCLIYKVKALIAHDRTLTRREHR